MVICLERDADLHIAKLMPLPLTVSCSSKIQIGFTFLVLAHPGRPGQRAFKWVCVCVCFMLLYVYMIDYFGFVFSDFILFRLVFQWGDISEMTYFVWRGT